MLSIEEFLRVCLRLLRVFNFNTFILLSFKDAMEIDSLENEEKKQGKHVYAISLSLTCHFFSLLFPPKPRNEQI